jgi:hypothetical protein
MAVPIQSPASYFVGTCTIMAFVFITLGVLILKLYTKIDNHLVINFPLLETSSSCYLVLRDVR